MRMGSCLSKHTLEPCLSSSSLIHFLKSYAAFVWSREALLYFISEVYSYFDAVTLFVGTTSFFLACNLKPSPSLLPHLFLPSSDTNHTFIHVSLHRGADANLALGLELGLVCGTRRERGAGVGLVSCSDHANPFCPSAAMGGETQFCRNYRRCWD